MTKSDRKVVVVTVEAKNPIDLRGIVQAIVTQINTKGVKK